MNNRSTRHTKYAVTLAMLTAAAMICSYLESRIPPFVPVPGVKLGLANAVTLLALFSLDIRSAITVSILRISLSALLFGNPVSFIYSISGGALSLVASVLLKRIASFSPIGISAAAGVFHNVGQMIAVAAVMGNAGLFGYLPVLLVSGTVAGALVGLAAGIVISRIGKRVGRYLPRRASASDKNINEVNDKNTKQ